MQNPVPFFIHSLTALSNCLVKAEAYAEAKRLKPDVLPNLRLVADMFPFEQMYLLTQFGDFFGFGAE